MSKPETTTDAAADGAPVSPGAHGLSVCPLCDGAKTVSNKQAETYRAPFAARFIRLDGGRYDLERTSCPECNGTGLSR